MSWNRWASRYAEQEEVEWNFELEELDGARQEFVSQLKGMSAAGFAASGSLKHMPVVDLPGFGRLPLPLDDAAVERLTAFCEQAPFGKGSETVVDLSVRNVLQADASGISFGNPHFQEELDDVFDEVTLVLPCAINNTLMPVSEGFN